jgi:hypothetical protein
MTTDNIETGFSSWERQVFTAMTGTGSEENLSLPEFTNLLAQGSDPVDAALADVINDYMAFHFGESGDKVIEVPANISAARLGDHEGSHHDILGQVHALQSTYYWGATEDTVPQVLSLIASIEASSDLLREQEFLTFLNDDILDAISISISSSTTEDVENGFITSITMEDIESMEAAIERLAKLSKV